MPSQRTARSVNSPSLCSQLDRYENEPWYVAEPRGLASFKMGLLRRLGVLGERQVPGRGFQPDGYRLETVGPAKMEDKLVDKVKMEAERIHGGALEGPYAVGGAPLSRCPFAKA